MSWTSLEIPDLIEEARRHGLHVLRLPLVDGSVPQSTSDVIGLLEQIHVAVANGERVVIHCAGGLGRSGVIAGCYLRDLGVSATDALEMLAKTRGPRCPETEQQQEYVSGWKHRRPKSAR